MKLRKRIMSFLLCLLMLSSICYVDMPTVKTINKSTATESFIQWYLKESSDNNHRGGNWVKIDEAKVRKALDASVLSRLGTIIQGVGHIPSSATTTQLDSLVTDAALKYVEMTGASQERGDFASVKTQLRGMFDKAITQSLNGRTVGGVLSKAGYNTASALAENQEMVEAKQDAVSIVTTYIDQTLPQEKAEICAYLIAEEIKTLKMKGFSDLAIIGAMCNIKAESHFDPYMIEGGSKYKFDEFGSNFTLKHEGVDIAGGTLSETEVVAKLTDGGRVNFNLELSPEHGIGLVQFTDCSTSVPSYADFFGGYRRSAAIHEFSKSLNDPQTCVIGCKNYTYWILPTGKDASSVVEIAHDDGSVETMEQNTTLEQQLCTKGDSTKIAMGSAALQLGYFAEQDGPKSWLFSGIGKSYLEQYYPEYVGMSFEEYKNFSGTGNNERDVVAAVTLFLLGVERPASTSQGMQAISDTVVNRANANVVEGIARIGGFLGYEGLDLDALSSLASNAFTTDNINGEGVEYTHLRALAQSGYFTSAEISQACAGYEDNVESELLTLADRSYLSKKQLYNLIAWEEQVHTTSLENNLILLGRQITLFIGIMILVWSLLFYLAYWLDRLNTMFYLDFVGILSMKRLQASDAPENSTYNLTKEELGDKKVKVVVHRDVIGICVMSITLGTLFATGTIFKVISGLIMWVWNFLR